MAELRTAEQVAADEALRAAVEQMRAAYGGELETYHLTEFVVMYACRGWTDDGDDSTAVGRLVINPAPSLHAQMGLLDYGLTKLRHAVVED